MKYLILNQNFFKKVIRNKKRKLENKFLRHTGQKKTQRKNFWLPVIGYLFIILFNFFSLSKLQRMKVNKSTRPTPTIKSALFY